MKSRLCVPSMFGERELKILERRFHASEHEAIVYALSVLEIDIDIGKLSRIALIVNSPIVGSARCHDLRETHLGYFYGLDHGVVMFVGSRETPLNTYGFLQYHEGKLQLATVSRFLQNDVNLVIDSLTRDDDDTEAVRLRELGGSGYVSLIGSGSCRNEIVSSSRFRELVEWLGYWLPTGS